jgi:hypothetical protein
MLLVRTRSHLKSVLRNKVVIFDTYHPCTLYLHDQRCQDPWLFFEAKRGLRAKKSLGNNNKEFCVLHVQSNTTIFYLAVQ